MNDLMLTPTNLPAYLVNPEAAQKALAAATAGLSQGFPPSIRTKAGKFRLVDSDGNDTIIKPNELADGEFLPVVILGFKEAFSKTYYAEAYDPSQTESKAPDCFSLDAVKPDASVKNPMCSTCAACKMNAFGSGRNQAGQPTKGKACSDNKILALMYKGGIYQFKIPPASLRNFTAFIKDFKVRSEGKLPPHFVITYIGFDDKADFSVLTFHVGGFVPEEALAKICRMADSPEVQDIVHPSYTQAQIAETSPAPAALEAAIPEKKVTPVVDLFGGGDPAPAKAETPKRGRPAKNAPVEAEPVVDTGTMTDDDFAKLLDI